MDLFCGTCGATPFMKLVERTLGLEESVSWQIFFRRAEYRNLLIEQLAALNENHSQSNFDALKFFLTRAFAANPHAVRTEIESKLAATPVGSVLERMKKHYEDRLAKQALSDPERAKARREEKKKVKAEAHRQRVEFYRSNQFISVRGRTGRERSE